MKNHLIALLCSVLTACGVETATTAATGAAAKKNEIAEGQKLQEETKRSVERSMRGLEQRARKESEVDP
jgi:hypothetical protein